MIALPLVALAAVIEVTAQEPAVVAAPPAPKNEALERQAVALLDEVLTGQRALKLPENRVRLLAQAAELLWQSDQKRARETFRTAVEDLSIVLRELATDEAAHNGNLSYTAAQLRQQMLQLVAPRDPQLALDFLRATRQPPPPDYSNGEYKQPDPELALELSLAQQIAANDPQQALRLAEESLQKGISSHLPQLLMGLRGKDVAAANKFAAVVFKKLRTADFARDYEATGVATYLLTATRPPSQANAGQSAVVIDRGNATANSLQVEESLRRELLDALFAAALKLSDARINSGNGSNLINALQQLTPEMERQAAPAQLNVLRRRVREMEQRQNPQAEAYREMERIAQGGTVENLLEAAKKAPPDVGANYYRRAAWKAFENGGIERGREILEQHVENKQQREQLLRELEHQHLWRLVEQPDVEQARQLLARLKSVDERISTLLHLSNVVADKGDARRGRQLLDEAWNQLGGRARNSSQFSLQLQIAQAYARHDPARSFEIIEGSIDRLNELLAAAVALDGFVQESFADGELRLHQGHPWNQSIEQCAQELTTLVRTDRERARAAADKFQLPEARLVALLGVARGILSLSAADSDGNQIVNLPLHGRRKLKPTF